MPSRLRMSLLVRSANRWSQARLIRRGGNRRPGRAAGGVEGALEADPVGINPGLVGGLGDEVSQGLVDAEHRPDFLSDTVGMVGAQHDAAAPLTDLDFFEGGF